jgi:chromosome segregation ATPase
MSDVKALSQSIQEEVDNRSKQLEVTEKSMHEIQKKHELLQKELESEHLSLKELIQQNEVQEKEVQRLQKIIFDRMNHDEADLEKKEYEIKEFPKRFSEFVSHKKEIHDIINVIGHEEIELRTEIDELRRQAKIIDISVGTAGYDKELVKLKDRMSSLTSKRSFFKEKIEQLTHILDWSTHRAVKEEKI